nr:hypothetical protein [Streptomyces sp. TLI_235]
MSLTPKARFLLISLFSSVTLLELAEVGGALRWPATAGTRPVSLLQDPAGLIVLAVIFVTPIFCCQQVRAIADFVSMNERNGGAAQLSACQIRQLNRLIARTNSWFAALGLRDVSAAIMAAMAVGTSLLYACVNDYGLLERWNLTTLPDTVWRSEAYAGWWANWHTHPDLALALCAAGTYAFYFLAKQLVMGVIFAVYLKRSAALGFGVTPNMGFDSDGFHGLRTLRQFMLWTYSSALAHLVGLLVLFMVWLPAAPWMLFVVVGVTVVDTVLIIDPSSIGYHSALAVKQAYARSLHTSDMPPAERDAAVAQVWSVPVLPVATRRAMTGITLYLLVPAVISLVPELVRHL